MNITDEVVAQAFAELVDDTTTFSKIDFTSWQSAVDSAVDSTLANLQEFEVLTQSVIDHQAHDFDGYLDGAKVGNLVWGTNDCWVSQSVASGWLVDAREQLNQSSNSVKAISEYVENALACERMRHYNEQL
ncbi:hypothetical protein NFHSH190041_37150 (plasmid) [Shewanella sp. NFH-SH190041]|uniref:hypothetical protein n=1 Tax=Shewanella sp. NFH-SH190041 TaxID=2950245 RepID=UPI0021C3A24C|nr:hypothetical protein [Shewanella sp. NFH-SH190041]BDM66263.1 hypothetical protein NFHSH190041_37150 [Shewanella sp. NFH-SH190041]